MNRNISFDENFPRYEKRKRTSDSDEEDSYQKTQDQIFKRQYDKQFKENLDYLGNQNKATNEFISDKEWEDLDSETGPKGTYTGALELQEGPQLEANLNAFENRGLNVGKKMRKGEDVSKKGVWGGKTKKARKVNKTKKARKANKAKKSRKAKK